MRFGERLMVIEDLVTLYCKHNKLFPKYKSVTEFAAYLEELDKSKLLMLYHKYFSSSIAITKGHIS